MLQVKIFVVYSYVAEMCVRKLYKCCDLAPFLALANIWRPNHKRKDLPKAIICVLCILIDFVTWMTDLQK